MRWFDTERLAARVERASRSPKHGRAANCGANTRIGGYSVVKAEDFDAALTLAEGCPGLEWGGGVEAGVFVELPGLASSRGSSAAGGELIHLPDTPSRYHPGRDERRGPAGTDEFWRAHQP